MEGADSGSLPKKRRANLKEGDLDPRISKALNFHDAIMADLDNVELAEGEQGVIFGVMRDVPDPYTGKTRHIVVPDADNGFWNALLNEAEQENTSTRFAVVGSPGIGKSTTVAFAIMSGCFCCKRKLLFTSIAPPITSATIFNSSRRL